MPVFLRVFVPCPLTSLPTLSQPLFALQKGVLVICSKVVSSLFPICTSPPLESSFASYIYLCPQILVGLCGFTHIPVTNSPSPLLVLLLFIQVLPLSPTILQHSSELTTKPIKLCELLPVQGLGCGYLCAGE